jgi:hypothetical protein
MDNNLSMMLISLGLYLIGYGCLAWSEEWFTALCIFVLQWASNIDNRTKYVEKQNKLLDLFQTR